MVSRLQQSMVSHKNSQQLLCSSNMTVSRKILRIYSSHCIFQSNEYLGGLDSRILHLRRGIEWKIYQLKYCFCKHKSTLPTWPFVGAKIPKTSSFQCSWHHSKCIAKQITTHFSIKSKHAILSTSKTHNTNELSIYSCNVPMKPLANIAVILFHV